MVKLEDNMINKMFNNAMSVIINGQTYDINFDCESRPGIFSHALVNPDGEIEYELFAEDAQGIEVEYDSYNKIYSYKDSNAYVPAFSILYRTR